MIKYKCMLNNFVAWNQVSTNGWQLSFHSMLQDYLPLTRPSSPYRNRSTLLPRGITPRQDSRCLATVYSVWEIIQDAWFEKWPKAEEFVAWRKFTENTSNIASKREMQAVNIAKDQFFEIQIDPSSRVFFFHEAIEVIWTTIISKEWGGR